MSQETLQQSQASSYIPSAGEKKRILLVYLLLGIMVILIKRSVSSYELFHIQQAIGRRMVFIVSLLLSVILLFLPYVYIVASIPFVLLVILWIYFVRQARNWYYEPVIQRSIVWVFAWLGQWLLMLFDLQFELTNTETEASVAPSVASSGLTNSVTTSTLDQLNQTKPQV
jgi:CBS domain containing-hemolysin-like protein